MTNMEDKAWRSVLIWGCSPNGGTTACACSYGSHARPTRHPPIRVQPWWLECSEVLSLPRNLALGCELYDRGDTFGMGCYKVLPLPRHMLLGCDYVIVVTRCFVMGC